MKWHLPAADTYFRPILTKEGFEIDHLEAALKHVQQFRTAVDGGAHVGTWSARMARQFDIVHAFEPAEDTFACLVKNVGHIGVQCHPWALGRGEALCRVVDDAARQGNTGARYVRLDDAEPLGVKMIALDQLGIEDLDLLKLDVEGYEYPALKGAEDTIKRCRPVVLIECKDFGGRHGLEVYDAPLQLERWGYREVERVRNDRIFAPA